VRLVSALIIAMGLVLAALIVVFLPLLIAPPQTQTAGFVDGPAREEASRLRIELQNQLDVLKGGVVDLEERLQTMQLTVATLEAEQRAPAAAPGTAATPRTGTNNAIGDIYAQEVLIANRREINEGLTVPTPRFLLEQLGPPREDLNQDCQGLTNPRLVALIREGEVGPIRVTMLEPALESLRNVMAGIEANYPDLYARLGTAGGLCVRLIRGSRTSVSTHSFGLAIDLQIEGITDAFANSATQLGLTILAEFFNQEGWVWGAGYGREDSMHFEVSQEKILEWVAQGKL
jgi:hypothetical protein